MRFTRAEGNLLYEQLPAHNKDKFNFSHINKMGNAHYANDSLIQSPIDFTTANNVTILHVQQLLQSALFPESVETSKKWRLTEDDYSFLYRFLSQYPSETDFPKYDTSVYYDSYVKFFFRNATQHTPPYVRVFNKVGWAYGCMTDVSYIVDFKHRVEFMLTATIYVNSNGVMNDEKYDYDTFGYLFFNELGQFFYQYELQRKRKYLPDISRFKMEYKSS